MHAIGVQEIRNAILRVGRALEKHRDLLTELDQAVGDGDLGITAGKIAGALQAHAAGDLPSDVGTYVAQAGMAINRAASSSLGTLLATALMRAGKEVKGQVVLSPQDLARMLQAADTGIQERGKAKPGDKTIIDVVHPAATTLSSALEQGLSLDDAGQRMLDAARDGMNAITPLRSKVGRAGWVGERTEGKPDPGCAAGIIILEAILGKTKEVQ